LIVLALNTPAILQAKEKANAEPATAGSISYNTRVAKVLDVDYAKHILDLEGEGGMMLELEVDPTEVKNFKNIKKGDLVKVQTVESLALSVDKAKKGEKPSADVDTLGSTAPVGAKPGAEQVVTRKITAEIVNVDKENSMVALKGPRGNVVDLVVKDPKKLAGVKKGDMVTATYTVARAISVEKAPKK